MHELKERGHEVIALDLGNTEREEYEGADVRNYRQLEKVFDKWDFDCVYHLAAEYGRWNGEDFYENLFCGRPMRSERSTWTFQRRLEI